MADIKPNACAQVFASRGDLAECALACVCACRVPHQWGPLLLMLQGGLTALQEGGPLHPNQQHLVDQLIQVLLLCTAYTCCNAAT